MTKIDIIIEDILSHMWKEAPEKLITMIMFGKLKKDKILSHDLSYETFELNFNVKYDDDSMNLSFELDEEALGIKPEQSWDSIFKITSEDVKEFNRIMQEELTETHEQIIEQSGEELVRSWKTMASKILGEQQNEFAEFQIELNKIWGKVLELLAIVLGTALSKGNEVNETYSKEVPKEHVATFRVVNYSFGRACQVSREIHLLLSSGFADGAEARWRTLHELAVVATFVLRNGEDTAIRYIQHEAIDTFKTLNLYQTYHKPEGVEVISEKDFLDIQNKRSELLKLYGDIFDTDYGWAAKALGKTDRGSVTFYAIEKMLNLTICVRYLKKQTVMSMLPHAEHPFVSVCQKLRMRFLLVIVCMVLEKLHRTQHLLCLYF